MLNTYEPTRGVGFFVSRSNDAAAARRGRFRCGLLLLGALLAVGAEAESPRRVLLFHSFGPDLPPFSRFTSAFRTELARLLPERVVFQEVSLNAEQTGPPEDEGPFVEFLRARYGSSRPELIVTIGAPATNLYLRHRERLFRDVPLLVTGVEQRLARRLDLAAGDFLVGVKTDMPRIVENILHVLPDTRTLGIIMGSSPLERFWLKQQQNDLAPFASRVTLLWLDGLTLEQLRERVAALPPHSALLYSWFVVGADGVPHENERALSALRAVTKAPLFGTFENQLGEGVVGGPHVPVGAQADVTAQHARRMLAGGTAAGESRVLLDLSAPAFDWRELDRWGIPESRLPAGAEVRFRPPSLWEQHRVLILAGTAIVLVQAALIATLVLQHARRRRAEADAVDLSGRLLTAHEDERRHLARELHDDLTQRLARLAIDAGRLEQGDGGDRGVVTTMRSDLVQLSEDVHALSYRLHPSVLDDLGLAEALRAECDRVARRGALRVEVDASGVPKALPVDASLCLFRVAQEALSNAARHAGASAVTVLLSPSGRGLRLAVSDNGSGFDPARSRDRPSLGLASMRERVRLVHGQLDIESTPGRGTTVVAWVPA